MIADKPVAVKKIAKFVRNIKTNNNQIGTNVRGMQVNFSNDCNFFCEHCFTRSAVNDKPPEIITVDLAGNIFDQLHELGGWDIDIQGGEPLIIPNLHEYLEAMQCERFLVEITTNGWHMTAQKARELKKAGIDRANISLDSFDSTEHDRIRGVKGAFEKALTALANIKDAGITPCINFTVSHQNLRDPQTPKLFDFAHDNQYMVDILPMTPTGCFQGRLDIIIDEKDTGYLMELRKKYHALARDLWDVYDTKKESISGCPSLNIIYLTPAGDVLPCPYIHCKIGNVTENSLKEILEKGFKIKYFHDYSAKCLSGEDISFIQKFLGHEMSIMKPIAAEELFREEDWITG